MSFASLKVGVAFSVAFGAAVASSDAEAQRYNPQHDPYAGRHTQPYPYGHRQDEGFRPGARQYDAWGNNRGERPTHYFYVPKGAQCPPGYSGSLSGNKGAGIRCDARQPKFR